MSLIYTCESQLQINNTNRVVWDAGILFKSQKNVCSIEEVKSRLQHLGIKMTGEIIFGLRLKTVAHLSSAIIVAIKM